MPIPDRPLNPTPHPPPQKKALRRAQHSDRGEELPETPDAASQDAAAKMFADAATEEGAPEAATEPPKTPGRCLRALVRIGAAYLPELLNASDEVADVPVTYMFWLGAVWLLMYSDEVPYWEAE